MTGSISPRIGAFKLKSALSAALVACMVWVASLPAAWAQAVVPKIIQYELPTGQTLLIKEDHSQPIVTIDTWVKTGSVNETQDINGVSHFLEHLLFKGTEKYKVGEIDRILESRGAEFNAATSDDFTHYYITTASPYFEEALRLHADMMLNAAIPQPELTRERKVVQEEINRANDNPSRQLYNELSTLLYGKHGYALDTLGPKEVIANVPREKILDYYHYWYQPRNFNTVIVGDVDAEKVKQLVASVFPAPPFSKPKHYQPPQVGPVTGAQAPQVKVAENPNISQSYIALGMLGPSNQKPQDVYALDIAMLALGGGKSSRLYQALKEDQPLATSVSAANFTQKYAGLLIVNAEAKPENRELVKKELFDQLNRLKAEGITEAELAKAKTQYLKDFIFENETTDGVASSVGYNVTIGTLADYLEHVSNVEKVTLDAVQSALECYIQLDRAVMVELLPTKLQADLGAQEQANLALLKQAAAVPPVVGQAPATQAISQSGSAEPAVQPAPQAQQVQKTVLENGITLIGKPLADSRTVAVKVFIKGGQGVETIPGTATLVSALLMQGTQNRTAEMISRELESQGMSLSVSADDDFIELTGAAIQEDLGELFAVLQDVLTHPAFEESEIAKKKVQLQQAITASRDNPSSVAFENLSMALYPDHPYGNAGKRVEAHLDLIDRAELLDYYRQYFQPQNMVVAVVGNYKPQTVQNYVNALYPDAPDVPPEAVEAVDIPPVPPLTESRTVVTEKPQLSAVWMAQGWLAPPIASARDYAALKVLNSLLGSGMSSRLFVDLREQQGLAYVVGSMYPSRAEQSRFTIYIGTDPANTDKVIAGFADEIRRLQTTLVPADELSEAKSKLIGSYALSHDTNINQAYYLGFFETLGPGYQFDRTYPDLVEQVSAADIQRVAKSYLAGPSVLSLVKPMMDNPKESPMPATQAP